MKARDATVSDLGVIRDLFNALIPTTTVAWREAIAASEEIHDWYLECQQLGHPVIVAEDDGRVVGYCSWGEFRGGPRFPGYRHTVELTIHVSRAHHRSGVGRLLIEALLARARSAEIHILVAGIDSENIESLAFHRSMGFEEVARMPETGRKFERWLDLVLMQRIVD